MVFALVELLIKEQRRTESASFTNVIKNYF